jgi:DNA-directed RNA polymerase specialized sigma24 family protein
MPRYPHPSPDWGTLEAAYTDEYGEVAPAVYAAAGRVWAQSRDYAARALRDSDEARARTLLLKAAARITRALGRNSPQIKELDGYLFQTFKRAVLAELEKEDNRRRLEAEAYAHLDWQGQATNVERRILLEELAAAMDEWTRAVFQWRTLDYSFDEIARHLGMNVKVLRNRYNRHLTSLINKVGGSRSGEDEGPATG